MPALHAQHRRLLAIETPLEDAVLVERFTGHEALSALFHFDIDCLATDIHLDFHSLCGETATLHLRLEDGHTRCMHGVVTEVRTLDADGGFLRFRLQLQPWLHLLHIRHTCRVFQDMHVVDILRAIFQEYDLACFCFSVNRDLRVRALAIQYRESDLSFVNRLLAEEGLTYRFEHGWRDPDAIADLAAPGMALHRSLPDSMLRHAVACHRMHIMDDAAALDNGAGGPAFIMQMHGQPGPHDVLRHFSQMRTAQGSVVTMSGWDSAALEAHAATATVLHGLPHVPCLEEFAGMIAAPALAGAGGERLAKMRAASIAQSSYCGRGESVDAALTPGDCFVLHEAGRGHDPAPLQDGAAWRVLSIDHIAQNNIHADMPDRRTDPLSGTYRNAFTCCPADLPLTPPYMPPSPRAPGVQVAIVVGQEDREIDSCRDHLVCIRFPWQRDAQLFSSDETAGIWVRVAEQAAGANWGSCFPPRVGQEVLIGFIGGDIERPFILGRLYGGNHQPPFQTAHSPPHSFSGYRAKEAGAGGYSQWLIDDTPHRQAQELSTTNKASRLQIGCLQTHPDTSVRGWQGTGYVLATQAWACLRAERGMLLSTIAQRPAGAPQLDTEHAQKTLAAAADVAQSLSDRSRRHGAAPLFISPALQALRERTTTVQACLPAGMPVPVFQSPLLLLDSAAGISFATAAAYVLSAARRLSLNAQSALRLSAGQALPMAAGNAVSLFAATGGGRAVAAAGPVSVQAFGGSLELLGSEQVRVTSSNGAILIEAAQDVLFTAGSGYLRLAGSDIDIHCPAAVSIGADRHAMEG
jgi:type VI secretion system secreted protein VgrG